MIATKSPETMRATDPYLGQFERLVQPTAGKHPAWLFPLRKAGMARFAEHGFPTVKDEDWRFTNVAPITRLPFKPVFAGPTEDVPAGMLERVAFAKLHGSRLVFVDGHFVKELSTLHALVPGVKVGSLASALASDSALIEKHLGRYAQTEENAFAALNTAFFSDGAFIYVPAGKSVEEPIQLIFLSTSKEAGTTVQPRNLIVVEPGGWVRILESYLSLNDAPTLTNAVTELGAGENAVVEHIKLQDESTSGFHIATTHGHLGRASNVNLHSFALGARLSRNNIRTKLAGEGLECILNGLYLTKGDQHADHHMIVEHAQPHCASHEYFNGILDDHSRGVFHGRILVHPVAQKTDAKQTNRNILLADSATVDTKPQLEIYADDVKCTHGATVGQLDEESIYYLRSRGIGLDTARQMLIHAFAGEIIDRVQCEPVREALDKLVWDRLEANPRLAEKR